MWKPMLKVAIATTAFGILHSLLASRAAKQTAERWWGRRNRNGLYRAFYLGQSAASFALLAAYIRTQPSQELYRATGPAALLLRSVQLAGLGYATAAAAQIGIRRVLGVESLNAWLSGDPVPPEPEAQGPALDEQGSQHPAGPFAWSRHPLNFAPLLVLWCFPRMTTSLLAFNLTAAVYLVLGSLHEEERLKTVYGDAYLDYQRQVPNFYLPLGALRGLAGPAAAAALPADAGLNPKLANQTTQGA